MICRSAFHYLTLWLLGASLAGAAERPNVVFFLVDDLGYGGLGRGGHPLHETPQLDAVGNRGMRFTNAYSACTVCSPSRAAILTGRYPARLRLTDWIPGHARPEARLRVPEWSQQIDHEQVTLPEAFRSAGYQTWFLGKWHLAPMYRRWSDEERAAGVAKHSPEAHGFDVNIGGREWGQPAGEGKYFYPFEMPGLEEGDQGEYLTDRLTDEALGLLASADDKPFLMYVSYYTVHTPLIGKAEDKQYFQEKAKEKGLELGWRDADYAAMHKSLDDSVGRIVDRLDELGLSENTVLVFTGDNGGYFHSACGGLRGLKGTEFEGGVREPTWVVWPGVTTPGSTCDTPVIGTDFYPTLLEIAGLDALPEQHVDGVSLAPLLRGTGGLDREALFWHYPHYHRTTPYSAIRRGDWRLIEWLETGELSLFDLSADPAEEHDLAESRPALAAELLAELRAWREEVGAQMPTPNPAYKPEGAEE